MMVNIICYFYDLVCFQWAIKLFNGSADALNNFQGKIFLFYVLQCSKEYLCKEKRLVITLTMCYRYIKLKLDKTIYKFNLKM